MGQRDSTLHNRELDLIDISRRPKTGNAAKVYPVVEIPVNSRGRTTNLREQRRQQRIERRRKRRRFVKRLMVSLCIFALLVFAGRFFKENGNNIAAAVSKVWNNTAGDYLQGIPAETFAEHPEWTEDFLTRNEYSRPGYKLPKVTNIFVHYTANPGTSAAQNRSYFEQQKDTHERSVSSHFIIGYEGEILQCVPLDEVAYAVQTRNYDSVSIECCYLAEDGSFTEATYRSLIELLAWLIDVYDLEPEDILRHYDCGGKKCPLYYTEHEDAWEQLKKDVDKL